MKRTCDLCGRYGEHAEGCKRGSNPDGSTSADDVARLVAKVRRDKRKGGK